MLKGVYFITLDIKFGGEIFMKKNEKSATKDVMILLSVWGPLLFILIGGSIYLNDGFNGTFMEKLFPALFWGLIAAFISLIIISNLLKKSELLWIITGIIVFIGTLIVYMMDLTNFFVIELIIITCSICLLSLIKMIMEHFGK